MEEDTGSGSSAKYTWMNAAYAMGANINRSFAEYGWCARIRGVESGGVVESLPTHTFPTDDGGVAMKCPTEIAITDRREAELSKNGFLPLCYWKNTDYAVFLGGQTVNKPREYDNPDATANANLSARLPYIFATSRFAHYLKCIVRDKIGSFKEGEIPACRGEGRSRRDRGAARLLQREVLFAPALSARGPDDFAAAYDPGAERRKVVCIVSTSGDRLRRPPAFSPACSQAKQARDENYLKEFQDGN